MAKNSTVFVCAQCGATSPKWIGKCPSCNKFSTYSEELVQPVSSSSSVSSARRAKPMLLREVSQDNFKRVTTGIGEFDSVLGGGIVELPKMIFNSFLLHF